MYSGLRNSSAIAQTTLLPVVSVPARNISCSLIRIMIVIFFSESSSIDPLPSPSKSNNAFKKSLVSFSYCKFFSCILSFTKTETMFNSCCRCHFVHLLFPEDRAISRIRMHPPY